MRELDDEGEVAPFTRITELIGQTLAAQLSAHLGGRRMYVPKNPGPHHPLSAVIGQDAAVKLAAEFPSARLDIPIAEGKRVRIAHMRFVEGKAVSEIARLLICTERHVYQVLAEIRRTTPSGQKSLLE